MMQLPKKLEIKLRQWLVYIGLAILGIAIVLLFKIDVVGIITIAFLMIIGSFSKIYKRFTGSLSLGFELITPVTVLFAYKIGIGFALVAAFIQLMIASFIAGKIDFPSLVCEMITYLILALLTVAFRPVPFVELGIAMMVLRNVIMFPMGVFFLGRNFIHLLIVIATDLFFNVLVMLAFGNFFAGLL